MDFSAHFPILIVVVPLLAATLTLLSNRGRIAWALTLAASVFCFLASLGLIRQLQDQNVLSYAVGGWAPPLGIEIRIDALSALLLLILNSLRGRRRAAPLAR